MDGSLLRFYVHENERVHNRLAWEWLLEQANRLGIRGGSAFRAMAGFGRRHVLHEERFFELAGTQTIEVEFVVTEAEARQIIDLVRAQSLSLFYAEVPARFGVVDGRGSA